MKNKKVIIFGCVILLLCSVMSTSLFVGYQYYYVPSQIKEYIEETKPDFSNARSKLDKTNSSIVDVFEDDGLASSFDGEASEAFTKTIELVNEYLDLGESLQSIYDDSSEIPGNRIGNVSDLDTKLEEYYSKYSDYLTEYKVYSNYFEKYLPIIEKFEASITRIFDQDGIDQGLPRDQYLNELRDFVIFCNQTSDELGTMQNQLEQIEVPENFKLQNQIIAETIDGLKLFVSATGESINLVVQAIENNSLLLLEQADKLSTDTINDLNELSASFDMEALNEAQAKIITDFNSRYDELKNIEDEVNSIYNDLESKYDKILFGLIK